MRARLTTEAGRVRRQAHRELRGLQRLVAIQVGDRHLRRRDEIELLIAQGVHVVLELGQLPRPDHRRTVHHGGNPHLLVAVLARVQVEHVRQERPHQTRTIGTEDDEARPADLGATREIEQAEPLADLPVRLHAGRLARRAPGAHDDAALLAPFGKIGQRHVRNHEQQPLELGLGVREPRIETRDLLAERARLRDDCAGVLLRLLEAGDLLTRRVARRLLLLDALDERTPLAIELLEPIETWAERVELPATAKRVAKHREVLAEQLDVVHAQLSGMPSANDRKPQLGSTVNRK